MNKTKIEWVKNPDGTQGYSWNPITGCLNGCGYCYARKLANTRLRERYLVNNNIAPYKAVLHEPRGLMTPYDNPFYPRFWPEKLLSPHRVGSAGYVHRKSKGIFVCDMSDLFGIGIPEEWTDQVLRSIKLNPLDRFYLLTKQPQNLIKFSPFPDNCWVGVSATNATTLYDACIHLSKIDAMVKYISMEPFLEWGAPDMPNIIRWLQLGFFTGKRGIGWLIIGAQTKPTVMPKIEWVKEIVEACDKAGIPVFLKDSLSPVILEHDPFNMRGKPKTGKLRQEVLNGNTD